MNDPSAGAYESPAGRLGEPGDAGVAVLRRAEVADETTVVPSPADRRLAAICFAAFAFLGWNWMLVPSLVRTVQHEFHQSDVGLGFLFLVSAACYIAGAVGGGAAYQRRGRDFLLPAFIAVVSLGVLLEGIAPAWAAFLLGVAALGFGSGAINVGINSLVLDLSPRNRGSALNSLHLFFPIGAVAAPLAVGWLVGSGGPWRPLMIATAGATLLLAALMRAALRAGPAMASIRRPGPDPGSGREPAGRLTLPLLAVAIAAGCYVAAESGVADWLVRFLVTTPLEFAALALALFWLGLIVGRLVAARIADRVDHDGFAIVACVAGGIVLVAAVLAPSVALSIVLFGAVGFAFGPVFPLLMAISGSHLPERSVTASTIVITSGFVGSLSYPPLMGFMAATAGIGAGMIGAAALVVVAGVAVAAGAGRGHRPGAASQRVR